MKACPVCGEQIQDVAKVCRFCGEILDPSVRKRKKKRKRGDADIGQRILFAIVWTVVFYFGVCMLAGGVIGFRAGMQNPGDPNLNNMVQAQAQQTITPLLGYFFIGSLVVASLGAWARVLPGTFRHDR